MSDMHLALHGLAIKKHGTPESVAQDRIVREVYLGEEFNIDVGA